VQEYKSNGALLLHQVGLRGGLVKIKKERRNCSFGEVGVESANLP